MPFIFAAAFAALFIAQTPRFIPGVWVSTPEGAVELIAFADARINHTLAMSSGTLEDVPTVRPHATLRVLTSLPNWRPVSVFIASAAIFRERLHERRPLKYTSRLVNVYSHEMRIPDLESEPMVARLFKSVRASEQSPAYAFIVMDLSGVQRFYPLRLALAPQ